MELGNDTHTQLSWAGLSELQDNHSLQSWNWGSNACRLSTFSYPHRPLLKCSFFYLILRIGFGFNMNLTEECSLWSDGTQKAWWLFWKQHNYLSGWPCSKLGCWWSCSSCHGIYNPWNNFMPAGLVLISLRDLEPGNFWLLSMSHTSWGRFAMSGESVSDSHWLNRTRCHFYSIAAILA